MGKDPVSKIKSTAFSEKQYGLRIGGPIIQNKLFFFANGELARKTAPTLFNAGETGSAITSEEATQLTTFVNNTYNYNLGTAAAFDARAQSDKYIRKARLEYK